MPDTVSEPREARELSCFVIGPIGDKDADSGSAERIAYEEGIQIFEEVIEPACRGNGVAVQRADKIARSGEITEQVFRQLRDSYLVIADLTGANPNVMYELGLRHTTGKLTIQVGERGRLPFDISTIRTIMFRRSDGGLVEARRRLSAAIAVGLEKGGDPVTSTRIWFEQTVPAITQEPSDQAQEEPGFLEKLAEMSEGMDGANMSLGAIPEVMEEITRLVIAATQELEKINASRGPASARLVATNKLAADLAEPASRLDVLVGNYSQSIERMAAGITFALETAKANPANEDARAFHDRVRDMIGAAEETFPKLQYFRDAAISAGEATRDFRRANKRIAASLDKLLATRSTFDLWKALL